MAAAAAAGAGAGVATEPEPAEEFEWRPAGWDVGIPEIGPCRLTDLDNSDVIRLLRRLGHSDHDPQKPEECLQHLMTLTHLQLMGQPLIIRPHQRQEEQDMPISFPFHQEVLL